MVCEYAVCGAVSWVRGRCGVPSPEVPIQIAITREKLLLHVLLYLRISRHWVI